MACDHNETTFITIMGTEAIVQWDNESVDVKNVNREFRKRFLNFEKEEKKINTEIMRDRH